MDPQLIEAYAAGAALPGEAIRDLTAVDLDSRPADGSWSIREIIVHLLDSDLVGSDRMKRVVAMDEAVLLAYDQEAFAANLHYRVVDMDLACELFRVNRQYTARLLQALPLETFERVGQHSEDGPKRLADLVSTYVQHLAHHLEHVRRKREQLGKPMN